jgi:MFS family permease
MGIARRWGRAYGAGEASVHSRARTRVYQVENSAALVKTHRSLVSKRAGRARVGRTVLLLGVVSLLTDISAEMVATVLPLYLLYTVGLSPLQYGFIDGIYQAGAVLVRVAGGFVGDRWQRHKEVAVLGYGVSAFCKLGLMLTGAWSALSAVILLDRAGKGVRTAPRDALISLSTSPEQLGTAFGVHRALDTTGAMLGPLVAFGILALTPSAFDSVFFVSFCFALVGLGILLLFVENPPRRKAEEPAPQMSLVGAARLLGERRFGLLAVSGAVLGLATISDGFVYLGLQRKLDFDIGLFPLLFVATAVVYMLLAVPVGRLADRVGRVPVFLAGYVLLLLVYACLLIPAPGLATVLLCTTLLGTYYAATDGVLAAIASALLPEQVRGTGLAALVTATSTGRLAASVLFGALWTAFGYQAAILAFTAALLVALAGSIPVLAYTQRAVRA